MRHTATRITAGLVTLMTGMATAALAQNQPTKAELDGVRSIITKQLTVDQRATLEGIAVREGKSPERLLWSVIGSAKLEVAKPKAVGEPGRRGISGGIGNEDGPDGPQDSVPSNTGSEDPNKPR